MCEIKVRRAWSKDVEIIADMDKRCFSLPWTEDAYRHELTENKVAMYLIAEVDGKPAGYSGVWLIFPEGHITNVAVLPEYRRLGVGTALIDIMIGVTEGLGVTSHTLEVRPSNDAAIALYTSFGFRPAGRRKHYYDDNKEDAIIMWRQTQTDEEEQDT